jgi:aryl-alcohol dehydrogenase-like predicted oxidoreductase
LKITLGTVQFGINYGISNQHGVPSDAELKTIFSVAKSLGIRILDTAKAYGNAEERIGFFSDNQFDIVSKFPKVDSKEALLHVLSETLTLLKTKAIYGYLAHNADVIIENPSLWSVLQEAKNEGKIFKIGFSLYQPEQLDKLLQLNCIPDLVQLPYSIFDRKFENQFPVLKQLGSEIHVRSVFLQGLYFMNPNQLPTKLKPLKSSLSRLHQLCDHYDVKVGQVALNYVIANTNIDQLVIGVETAEQLQQNCKMISNWKVNPDVLSQVEAIEIKDKSLLNPVNW